MTQTVLILGRQPALGTAEAESLFGADKILAAHDKFVVLDLPPLEVHLMHMGGSTRVAKLLTYLPYTDWNRIEHYLEQELPKHTCCLPEGKIRLGLSTYGLSVNPNRLNATGLKLKKVVKEDGRSVRVVPNKSAELNTAQVIHNQLTGPTGMELILIRNGDRTILAQTEQVQDIEAYAARDQARPARDAKVGMLPPKLAQIILNLAVVNLEKENPRILDPFCGTGVLLQEAMLMHYNVTGSDIDPRMIDYSNKNLQWLQEKYSQVGNFELVVDDATSAQWDSIETIACETYLGRPFSLEPKPDVLRAVTQNVDTIHRKFLQNVAHQTKSGFRMCIAVPAWKTKSGFKHLKVLDSLEELGYNRVSFVHADTRELIYHRENQIVGRELVVLQRI